MINKQPFIFPLLSSCRMVGQEFTPPTSEYACDLYPGPDGRDWQAPAACFGHVLRCNLSNHGGSAHFLRCERTCDCIREAAMQVQVITQVSQCCPASNKHNSDKNGPLFQATFSVPV